MSDKSGLHCSLGSVDQNHPCVNPGREVGRQLTEIAEESAKLGRVVRELNTVRNRTAAQQRDCMAHAAVTALRPNCRRNSSPRCRNLGFAAWNPVFALRSPERSDAAGAKGCAVPSIPASNGSGRLRNCVRQSSPPDSHRLLCGRPSIGTVPGRTGQASAAGSRTGPLPADGFWSGRIRGRAGAGPQPASVRHSCQQRCPVSEPELGFRNQGGPDSTRSVSRRRDARRLDRGIAVTDPGDSPAARAAQGGSSGVLAEDR